MTGSTIALVRWLISLVAVLLLALLVWLFGPLLPQLEEAVPRIGVAVALLLVWAVGNLAADLRRRANDQALQRGVAASAANEEAAALQARLASALKLLRRAGARLAEQPWYVIIGPPGAGKTTALLNSGLHFPLADKLGPGAVAGVGGTRMCDWWFTDDAVLIDTAGRYTTQDSDATVDRAGWMAFLDLLRRTRPRQPLNGVIVAIALSDIATATPADRTAHARAIRGRLEELHTKLGVRLPVYLMFTKADLVAGFTAFFDDLDRVGRTQVWGASFPQAESTAAPFAAAFRDLAVSLRARLFDRLQAERGPERRALIAGFPAQIASLAKPLEQFIQETFAAPAPMLRGVYFTSGTQEGTPIDRLTSALSRSFGIDQMRAPSLRPEQGRSYFLTDLIQRVVFGEAGLVGDNPAARRRARMLRAAMAVALFGLVIASAGVLWWRVGQETRSLAALGAALDQVEAQAAPLKLDPVADADLARVLPLLDRARALALDAAAPTQGPGLGLEQDAKRYEIARTRYRHVLERVLLPRLVWQMEAELRADMAQPDRLYDATRVYLMLGSAGPLDRGLVRDWMSQDFARLLPGDSQTAARAALAAHLEALMDTGLPEIPLDGALVTQARAQFAAVPLAARVYARIRPSAAAQALAPWRPSEAMGAPWVRMFVRASGRKLTEGIAGFFTLPGFHSVLLPSLDAAVRSVAGESWVLGRTPDAAETGPAALAAAARDVIRLYEAAYIKTWDSVLLDLNMAVPRSLPQAAQEYFILASPQSPMRALLVSAARQVTLSQKPDAPLSADLSRLGLSVDAHFQTLRSLVGDGPGAPIEQPLQALSDLQQMLAKIATAPIGSAPQALPAGGDPALALRAEAQRAAAPLGRWLQTLLDAGVALRSGNLHALIAVAYNAPGGPGALCNAVVKGRYPFQAGAAPSTQSPDFALLFGRGGQFDQFFDTQLRPYVTITGGSWKPVGPEVISAEDLAQLQRAAAIRDGGGVAREFRCPQFQ